MCERPVPSGEHREPCTHALALLHASYQPSVLYQTSKAPWTVLQVIAWLQANYKGFNHEVQRAFQENDITGDVLFGFARQITDLLCLFFRQAMVRSQTHGLWDTNRNKNDCGILSEWQHRGRIDFGAWQEQERGGNIGGRWCQSQAERTRHCVGQGRRPAPRYS